MKILLKISWEALSWHKWFWFDETMMQKVSDIVKELTEKGHSLWIVVWAWNFIRWSEIEGMDRAIADNMWMLAININALALYDYFTKKGIKSKNLNSFAIDWIAQRFNKPRAMKFLDAWWVIVFGWWTGNPYFTTDTAWVLRALEIEADIMIKATKVDWLYSKDPKKYDDAEIIKKISYIDFIDNSYNVMDLTAITLAKTNNLKIKIVNLYKENSILNVVSWIDEWSEIS